MDPTGMGQQRNQIETQGTGAHGAATHRLRFTAVKQTVFIEHRDSCGASKLGFELSGRPCSRLSRHKETCKDVQPVAGPGRPRQSLSQMEGKHTSRVKPLQHRGKKVYQESHGVGMSKTCPKLGQQPACTTHRRGGEGTEAGATERLKDHASRYENYLGTVNDRAWRNSHMHEEVCVLCTGTLSTGRLLLPRRWVGGGVTDAAKH